MVNYFPTTLIKGLAFCNRQTELKRLKHNIQAVSPTLIISSRRYGKTSLGEVCHHHAVEAAIREVVQQSEYLVFIFSGSNRHLIGQLFNDKKRPFYKLCDTIKLDRISEMDYERHLQKASRKKWNSELSQPTVEAILGYTERHAYYLNKLCSVIWQESKPTPNLVADAWFHFVFENKSEIERELSLLTLNQRKILTAISKEDGVMEPFGKIFLSKINLSNSSAAAAIKFLLRKDYLCLDAESNQYQVLDPLIKSVLSNHLNRLL